MFEKVLTMLFKNLNTISPESTTILDFSIFLVKTCHVMFKPVSVVFLSPVIETILNDTDRLCHQRGGTTLVPRLPPPPET